MTNEELIEQIARTVGQKIEGAAEDMDSAWYGAPLWKAYVSEAEAVLPIIEADREAVRAEVSAELAKFKALADTLAGALDKLHEAYCADDYGTSEGRAFGRAALIETREALRQYKEARDV